MSQIKISWIIARCWFLGGYDDVKESQRLTGRPGAACPSSSLIGCFQACAVMYLGMCFSDYRRLSWQQTNNLSHLWQGQKVCTIRHVHTFCPSRGAFVYSRSVYFWTHFNILLFVVLRPSLSEKSSRATSLMLITSSDEVMFSLLLLFVCMSVGLRNNHQTQCSWHMVPFWGTSGHLYWCRIRKCYMDLGSDLLSRSWCSLTAC